MRFRLRTLLIVVAVGPMVLAAGWWGWREWQERRAAAAENERRQMFEVYIGPKRYHPLP